MQKGDYVSHYAVRGILTAEEYTRIYDNKKYTPTLEQMKEKDYIYRYSNNEYWIGEYEDYYCERSTIYELRYARYRGKK